jgi:tRNA-Thr(GGU) m(6)t(6)A37 methyltransferase TsaA
VRTYGEILGSGEFHFRAIGVVRSPFKDKFGVPRQPGLAASARGTVVLHDDPDLRTALRSLDQFTHLWIVFVFHEHGGRNWKPSIRPPRLGGSEKVGVLASRSPHRPNPIGLSAVAIERIDFERGEISVSGVDLIDGTPVLDIKPYIPYADSFPSAGSGWASGPITRYPVTFECSVSPELREMITDVLELDPRPAFQQTQLPVATSEGSRFGIEIGGAEVKYEIRSGGFVVTGVVSPTPAPQD